MTPIERKEAEDSMYNEEVNEQVIGPSGGFMPHGFFVVNNPQRIRMALGVKKREQAESKSPDRSTERQKKRLTSRERQRFKENPYTRSNKLSVVDEMI